MRLTILYDHRFFRDSDGTVFSASNYNYELFSTRYLEVFDEVNILSRVSPGPAPRERAGDHVEGPGVRVIDMGNWTGFGSLARSGGEVVKKMGPYLSKRDAVIGVGPGRLQWIAHQTHLRQRGGSPRPYGVEVIGDPADEFAPGAFSHPLRGMIARMWPREVGKMISRAAAVSYVSETVLRKRYPASPDAFVTHYSSVNLPDDAILETPKEPPVGRVQIGFIGSLNGLHKGPDTLLKAVAACRARGLDVGVSIIGSGREQEALQRLACALEISDEVKFLGQVSSGAPVWGALDQCDLFVLPTLAEGLPRAVVEAMARGLPALASDVGGIVDLLPAEDRFAPRDPDLLARKIFDVVSSPERMRAMAERNLTRSRDFRATLLQALRMEFYKQVRDRTAA